jgi:hypothetical protein
MLRTAAQDLHGEAFVGVYPRIGSAEVHRYIGHTPRTLAASGVAAQRMISLAWNRRVGGIVIPRASAVFRLITNANVVACSTGKSIG